MNNDTIMRMKLRGAKNTCHQGRGRSGWAGWAGKAPCVSVASTSFENKY